MNLDTPVALLVLLPLLGFIINYFFGKKLPKALVGLIGCGTILGGLIISTLLFIHIYRYPDAIVVNFFNWIQADKFSVDMAFLVDRLSCLMLLIITGVGFLIHVYSIGYMHDDEGYARFFSYLNLFVFFMQMLVLGANYLITFIGWEGVGLCSYLLIGFWYKNQEYNNAAKKAFIMNRIGDLGFLIGLFTIFYIFGTLNYVTGGDGGHGVLGEAQSYLSAGNFNDHWIILITILLFIGATGKSAQIPLFTWLPDAMAGPTPVSALIHAATMVTAGIYLIVRSHILFTLAPATLEVIMWIGVATAFFAATIGLKQNDIKKVLAYSTVSQLGYMFVALGLGAYSTAMFHLTTHAFFKALLFLGAGSVIHAMGGEQDIMKMGGLRKKIPITFITFLIGTLAISGIPPFAGFFSKDEILAKAFEVNKAVWAIAFITAVITAFYMFRLVYLTFFGSFRGTHDQEHHLHESPPSITFPLIVLAILSTLGGFLGIPGVFAHGAHAFNSWFAPLLADLPAAEHVAENTSTEWLLMGLAVAGAVISWIIAARMFSKKEVNENDVNPQGFGRVLAHKYYIDELYNAVIVRPFEYFSGLIYRILESSFIDGIVNGVSGFTRTAGGYVKLLETGNLGFYLFAMVVGIVVFLLFNLKFLF
jgi:NADH-quinone oxidoreductase subunit L